jgi:hypothetical protein
MCNIIPVVILDKMDHCAKNEIPKTVKKEETYINNCSLFTPPNKYYNNKNNNTY